MAIPAAPTTLPAIPADLKLDNTNNILIAIYAVLIAIYHKP